MAALIENLSNDTVEYFNFGSYEFELMENAYVLYENAQLNITDDIIYVISIGEQSPLAQYSAKSTTVTKISDKSKKDGYDILNSALTEYRAEFERAYPERKFVGVDSAKGVLVVSVNAKNEYENSIVISNRSDSALDIAIGRMTYNGVDIKNVMMQKSTDKSIYITPKSAKIFYIRAVPNYATITYSQDIIPQ